MKPSEFTAKPHRVLLTGSLLVSVALLSACGGDSDSTTENSGAAAAQSKAQLFGAADNTSLAEADEIAEFIASAADSARPMARALAVNSTALTATAMATAATTTGSAIAATSANCDIHLSKSFGDFCYAAASANVTNGARASFPNTRAGYRGKVTATCVNGTVIWGLGTCTYIASTPIANDAAVATTTAAAEPVASDYKIGSYYFPGWKNNQTGNGYPIPWDKIELYVDRKPSLGWYAEDDAGVMSQQLKWMKQYGLDYVVFDFLWGPDSKAYLTAAIDSYVAAPDRFGVEFSILWANHTKYIFSKTQFETLFSYWTKNYLNRADYLKIDGKPVIYLFSADVFDKNAKAIGMTTDSLIAMANDIAIAQGLTGVAFIGGMYGNSSEFNYSATNGYSGFSAYNFHSPATIALAPYRVGNNSHTYAELDKSYRNQWDWMLKNSGGTYIIPMSSGWDKRPWGGSTDPLHDDSRSVPAEFKVHLQAAKKLMDEQPTKTQKMGVICCWNEFGEGSFIEPTKVDGFKYLEQIKSVFGGQ